MGSSPRCSTCIWFRPPRRSEGRGYCNARSVRVEPGFGCEAHARRPKTDGDLAKLQALVEERAEALAVVERTGPEIQRLYRRVRAAHALSRRRVAERAGYSTRPVRQLEAGAVPPPETLRNLTAALARLTRAEGLEEDR